VITSSARQQSFCLVVPAYTQFLLPVITSTCSSAIPPSRDYFPLLQRSSSWLAASHPSSCSSAFLLLMITSSCSSAIFLLVIPAHTQFLLPVKTSSCSSTFLLLMITSSCSSAGLHSCRHCLYSVPPSCYNFLLLVSISFYCTSTCLLADPPVFLQSLVFSFTCMSLLAY
jgi:hypothetical protein